jgi:hypothetical protein
MPLVASATAQQGDPSRLPTRVISPVHAQESPVRAASDSGWRQVAARTWSAAQYHPLAPRYHPRSAVSDISVRISTKHERRQPPNCPRKLALNVVQVSGPDCLDRLPVLAALVVRTGSCRTAGTRYHPRGAQYQGAAAACRTSTGAVAVARSAGSARLAVARTHVTRVQNSANASAAQQASVRLARRPSKPRQRRAVATPAVRRHAAAGGASPAAASNFPARMTLLAGLGLMLLAAAIAAGPLVRSRLQSRALSNQLPARRGGIRYRD